MTLRIMLLKSRIIHRKGETRMPFPLSARLRKIAAKPVYWSSIILLLVLTAVYASAVASASALLRRNLHIGRVAVGCLTREQAVAKLKQAYAPALALPLTLTYKGGNLSASPAALGLRIDYARAVDEAFAVTRKNRWNVLFRPIVIPVPVAVNDGIMQNFFTPIAAATETAPRDAAAIVQGDTWTIEPESCGSKIDFTALASSLQEAVLAPADRTVAIPCQILPPRVSAAELSARGAEEMLSKFHTFFDESDINRSSNIRVGCEAIRTYWVEPGGILSYNGVTARSANSGRYKEAKVYEQGRVVLGLGGGICQVSSTLYNAALLAGLEIIERHPHSLTVPYVAPGRDATVSEGSADLKFKNTTGHYILIAAAVSRGRLTVRVFGRAVEPREIEIRTAVIQETIPSVLYIDDPDLAAGEQKSVQTGKKGCQVKTWRIIKKDGIETSRSLLSIDTYQPLDTIVRVGAETAAPPGGPTG